MTRLDNLKVVIALAMRYMDDGRVILAPIKAGWRWVEGGLKWCKKWEVEDCNIDATERTSKILHHTMNDIEEFLTFTMETSLDFSSGWLATLDTDLQMTEKNTLEYKFYEKPMSSNVTVQKDTAMDENQKIKTLSNELTRRLLNTSESLGDEERVVVVDRYTQKLINSGFGVEQTRKIVVNGILAYERKLRESRTIPGRKIHRTAQESSGKRLRKKLLDKTEWFKKKKRVEDTSDDQAKFKTNGSGGRNRKVQPRSLKNENFAPQTKDLKTRTILFVEKTRDWKLAKTLREVFKRLEGILGLQVTV